MIKECLVCNTQFETKTKSNYCSKECKTTHKKEIRAKVDFEKNNKKYEGLEEGFDFVVCKECGLKGKKIQFHIQMAHNISVADYKLKHNVDKIISQKLLLEQSERVKGDKNPAYQHGGRLSPFSDKFIGKTTKEEAAAKSKKTKTENPQNENTKLEYYTSRGYTEEEAIQIRSERQSTFSLEKCIEKYGEEEGHKKWLARQEKWHKSYKKSNFSKISQKLFWEVYEKLENKENIYFAELSFEKQKDSSGKNNEYTLVLERVIKPDFIDVITKKIIEFDGVYWHGEKGRGNKMRNEERDEMITKSGYQVFHVDENDYRKNKNEVVEKCLNFLKQ